MSAAQLGAVLDLIADGTISGKIAKDLFEIVWTEGGDPRAIVEARGMKQVTDLGAIEKIGRRDRRQQSGQGRAGQDESEGDRLVRRPGDEGVRRQGQPAGGQRSAKAQTRSLTPSACARAIARARRRRACATARENFATRMRIVATRVGSKITAADDARGANHLAPIRSFLIDSDRRTTLARGDLCKIFLRCKCASHQISIDRKNSRARARYFFARGARDRKLPIVQKILISSMLFATSRNLRSRARRARD